MSFCMTNGHTRQKKSRYHGIAQGTLFTVIGQTGWEGSLGENGYVYMSG